MASAEPCARLARIAKEEVDLGWTKIAGIDFNENLAGLGIKTFLIEPLVDPFDRAADLGECEPDELTHGMGFACCQHVIVRLFLLDDPPHGLGIVTGMALVALCVEIAEIKLALETELNRRHRPGNLAGDERFAADRALVIEHYSV